MTDITSLKRGYD